MDHIFKLYKELLNQPNEYSVYTGSDQHELNINLLKNNQKQEIDLFRRHYSQAFKIIEPKLNAMRKLVYVPSLKGHIEMKEDGYADLWREYQTEIDHVIRHAQNIESTNRDIADEINQREGEKKKTLLNAYELKEVLTSIIPPAKDTKQLAISF